MERILITFFDVKDIEKEYLYKYKPENCEFIVISDPLHKYIDENIDKVKDSEIISVFTSTNAPGNLLKQFPNLKLVTTRSTGFNNVDLDYCKEHNIPVVNVPKYGDCTVAEYAFGLLLDVMRKITFSYLNLKEGIINIQSNIGHDLMGKTIGIVGTGAIGCHAIKIANGFGMNIICYDPYPKEEMKLKFNVKYVSLDQLLTESDVISLHAPSTKENFHMINDECFNKMKKGVIIINTARGEIMDTQALYKAIKNGIVAGAGLDVLECEDILANEDQYLIKVDCIRHECLSKTLINHKLLEMPNVIVTPHVAFDSVEAVYRILKTTIDNINGYLSGNVINKVN
ncbi:MAG: NAD(P)-dependent oxidoreductase [Candidatus Gastranaerophilales bacterium]|nr:NAD(P)-dependent oxidoreductase [Candidatus Gastranaerophilales bacterium]